MDSPSNTNVELLLNPKIEQTYGDETFVETNQQLSGITLKSKKIIIFRKLELTVYENIRLKEKLNISEKNLSRCREVLRLLLDKANLIHGESGNLCTYITGCLDVGEDIPTETDNVESCIDEIAKDGQYGDNQHYYDIGNTVCQDEDNKDIIEETQLKRDVSNLTTDSDDGGSLGDDHDDINNLQSEIEHVNSLDNHQDSYTSDTQYVNHVDKTVLINPDENTLSHQTTTTVNGSDNELSGLDLNSLHVQNDVKRTFNCKLCSYYSTTTRNLRRHMLGKHGKRRAYECSKCPETFKNLGIYMKHLRMHRTEGRPFKCLQCDLGFETKYMYDKHMKRKHGKIKEFCCAICNDVLESARKLRDHARKHKKFTSYHCVRCQCIFPTFVEWQQHKKMHEMENKYECPLCGKCYKDNAEMNYHQQEVHIKKSSFCSPCNKHFSTVHCLQMHVKACHNTERPFKCTYCENSYVSIGRLNVHMKKHTQEPYRCHVCDKTFISIEGFRKHMPRHDGLDSRSSYFCDICGKTVTADRTRHIQMHSGTKQFSCVQCGARFKGSHGLKRHIKIHSKPFACTSCDKRFARKCARKIHMRTHTISDVPTQSEIQNEIITAEQLPESQTPQDSFTHS